MDENAWRRRLCGRVREIRRQCGMSQMQFALKADLSYHTIGKIERFEAFPELTTLIRLSEAHSVPLSEFFQEEVKAKTKSDGAIRDVMALLRRRDEKTVDLAVGMLRFLLSKL